MKRKVLLGFVLLLMVNCAAMADTFFTNAGAWAAAVNSTTSVNFEGLLVPGDFAYIGYGPGASTSVGAVQFSVGAAGVDNLLFVLGDGYYGFPVSTIAPQSTSAGTNDLLITLPGSYTALAFDFSSFVPLGPTTITLSDGASITLASGNAPNLIFFGATTTTGVSWVDISVPGYGLNVDGITYGSANAPEPGSLVLLGSGILGIASVVRRKFRL